MTFDAIVDVVLYILIPIWMMAEVFIIKWMFKAKPGKNITCNYPKKIIFLSQLPFGTRWMKWIDKVDHTSFQTYQRRIRIGFLSVMIPLFIIPLAFWLYMYIDWYLLNWNRWS
jgi:hypothetical protein